MIRVQNMVPEVYVNESRDFQVLCRDMDMALNQPLLDANLIRYITNTSKIKQELIPLLESRIGYFTNLQVDNSIMRIFLEAFPLLVKYKGTTKGLQYAINTYLKAYKVDSSVAVIVTNEGATIFDIPFSDHTVIISLSSAIDNVVALEDLLQYVLPTGFNVETIYVKDMSSTNIFNNKEHIDLIYVSDDINSMLRSDLPAYTDDIENKVIGAVDTANTLSEVDDPNTLIHTYLKV